MFKQLYDFRCGLKELATVNSLRFIKRWRQFQLEIWGNLRWPGIKWRIWASTVKYIQTFQKAKSKKAEDIR